MDSATQSPIPPVIWKNYNWQNRIKIYSLAFYPPKGSLFNLNTSVNNFDSYSSKIYFSSLQINKTGMYILLVSVNANEKYFITQCFSNPIRVAKMQPGSLLNSSINNPFMSNLNQTMQNYVLRFKAIDSIVFTVEEANKIKASIYNCMENYNISVFNLELTSTRDFVSSRYRRQSQAQIISLNFYSSDSNPTFIKNLSGLNVSEFLIFVSARVNGVDYGGEESLPKQPSSSSVVGIVVGCIIGISLILLIALVYFCNKKFTKPRRTNRNYVVKETLAGNTITVDETSN